MSFFANFLTYTQVETALRPLQRFISVRENMQNGIASILRQRAKPIVSHARKRLLCHPKQALLQY